MVKWYCLNSFDLLVDLKKGLMWMLPCPTKVLTEPPRSSPVGVYYIQWYCIYILVVSSSYLASHFFFNIWTIIHDPYMIVLQYIFSFILVPQWYCCEPLQIFSLKIWGCWCACLVYFIFIKRCCHVFFNLLSISK
mgnify:CR=1 FL=1